MTALKLANRRVFKAGESRDDYTGMGTTVVAGLVEGGRSDFRGSGGQPDLLHGPAAACRS